MLSHPFPAQKHINHSARLYMGYRWYDEQKIHQQFCFGFKGCHPVETGTDWSLWGWHDGSSLRNPFQLISALGMKFRARGLTPTFTLREKGNG
jgi:hypothetical protein